MHNVGEIGVGDGRRDEVERAPLEDLNVQRDIHDGRDDDHMERMISPESERHNILPAPVGEGPVGEDQMRRLGAFNHPGGLLAGFHSKCLDTLPLQRALERAEMVGVMMYEECRDSRIHL